MFPHIGKSNEKYSLKKAYSNCSFLRQDMKLLQYLCLKIYFAYEKTTATIILSNSLKQY